jgi:hypothetical protein
MRDLAECLRKVGLTNEIAGGQIPDLAQRLNTRLSDRLEPQGLKPSFLAVFMARLKSRALTLPAGHGKAANLTLTHDARFMAELKIAP